MRILFFSDTHGSTAAINAVKKKAKNADILVCAGDLTIFEEGLEMMMQKLDLIGKKVLMIHGNHESSSLLRQVCKLFKNTVYIHKKAYCAGDFAFVGYGGGGFSMEDKGFERFAAKLKIPRGRKIILVTHGPPYKTKLDYIWEHRGNKSYRKFIEKKKPVIAVSGHFHETEGKEDRIGSTRLINPGPKGKIIRV
ncbi:metallophosphoesterase family protein [Candidatus Woesearchaeota archaeon]|nr:metallophosphoesterase family protein [Candidatus Woesearchaeota archaeon]